jgi:cellulose synthase/poly-beta-1,6-N-acetylglucosamine synthase-like glycosyltransferase
MEIDYPKDKMEVIVIDSSTDKTPTIVEELSSQYPIIKLIHDNERKGLATALNKAYKVCKGEIIVKMDSDVILDKDTLHRIISVFNDPNVGAVTGKIVPINKDGSSEVSYRSMQDVIQKAETCLDSIYMSHPLTAYRRTLMKHYKINEYGDESIQTIHIRKQGYKIIYNPYAKFYEYFSEDNKERLQQKIRRAEGHVRILFENVDIMFNKKYGRFGMYVFPSNFFMLIISPFLLFASIATTIVDLFILSYTVYFDIFILSMLGLVIIGRKHKYITPIWSFIELQYAQLRACINVILNRHNYMWNKAR